MMSSSATPWLGSDPVISMYSGGFWELKRLVYGSGPKSESMLKKGFYLSEINGIYQMLCGPFSGMPCSSDVMIWVARSHFHLINDVEIKTTDGSTV